MTEIQEWTFVRGRLKGLQEYVLISQDLNKYCGVVLSTAWKVLKILRRAKLTKGQSIKDMLLAHLLPYIERAQQENDQYGVFFLETAAAKITAAESHKDIPGNWFVEIMDQYAPYKFPMSGNMSWGPIKEKKTITH